MNDFTKEELNFIWQRLAIADYSNFKDMAELPNKVCAMINNYCEQNPNKPNFTQDQKNFICYKIGDWYLMMKPLLEGQHNLGYMKEKLKIMVCDDEMLINC